MLEEIVLRFHTFKLSHIHFYTFTSKLQPGWRKYKSSVGCGKKLYYGFTLSHFHTFTFTLSQANCNLVGEKIRAVLDVERNCIRGDEGLSLTAPTDHTHFYIFLFLFLSVFLCVLYQCEIQSLLLWIDQMLREFSEYS